MQASTIERMKEQGKLLGSLSLVIALYASSVAVFLRYIGQIM